MDTPFPGLKVYIESDVQLLEYLDNNGNLVKVINESIPVTNYEYEVKKNEEKRKILILKPEYLGVFVSDTKAMMKYEESSQFIDSNTKQAYNPRNNT
jgi:hypothetical protein